MAACRHCGSELPEAARFCPACGAPVGGPAGEERKVVTVLFADLVDSTVLGDGRDPEVVRAAVHPQLARMRTELERYGGTFEKYVGDAVMAVFGAPTAHEDDPERAVRAALAIRDAIPGVKVAVNTGEAVVQLNAVSGSGEGLATGDVVTTTFRIEEAADAGHVLVGVSTFRATQAAIEYGERRVVQAKGKVDPIPIYEALRTRSDARESYEGRPLAPLIGRREELSMIIDTIARARRDRTVQLVTLVGVPGIGKSRLVWELGRAVSDDPGLVTWRRGRCLPYGNGVTFWALGEMVKAQAGILESDASDAAEEKLGRAVRDLVADGKQATWVENHVRPLVALEAPPAERREEAFAAWRQFFEALAEWGPLVLVFEDLHWADEGLLDFLDHLADWTRNVPIVLLCTARPELLERRAGWGGRSNAATIALPPLSNTETATLVGQLLRQSDVPSELRDVLVERAEGNPLYAEEFVRMLVDRGLLYRENGDWRLRSTNLPLPESVQGLVAARLDALSPNEKATLRDAAVIGRGFWPAAVSAVSGLEPGTVDAALFSLERKELVRRLSASSVATELQYSFHHAVVRDVAYNTIPRVERAEKHRLTAEWIEGLGRREDHSETIAHHYLAALEYARAASQPTDTFAGRARAALRSAGERALALNAPAGAARYFAGALELTLEDERERPELLFLEAKSLYRTGHPDEGLLEQAQRAFLKAGDAERAAECQAILGDVHWRQGDRDAAFALLEQAISGLAKPSYAKAFALSELARMRNAASEPETAVALGVEALDIADALELRDLRVSALTTIGIARTLTGDAGGIDDLRRSVDAAEEMGSPESVRAYYNLGAMLGISGQLLASFDALAEGRELAHRFGDAAWIAWYDAERLYEHYWRGAWDDALELGERIVSAGEPAPASVEFDAALVRSWIALARGNGDDALESVRRAHALAREAPDPQNLLPALASLARTTSELLGDEEAAGYVEELLEGFSERPSPPGYWVFDLAVAADRLARGEAVFDAVRRAAPSTRWLQAAHAIVRGEPWQAADLFGAIGAQPEEAYCRLIAAAREDGTEPRRDGVGSALAFYRRVGATSYAQEAESLLAARRPG